MVEMITFAAEVRASRRQGAGPRAAPRRPGAGGDLRRAQGPGDGLARGPRAAPPARATRTSSTRCAACRSNGEAVRVLPRDVQLHPVTDDPIHADFVRVSAGATVEVEIPVVFVNEEISPGLKRGGVLNIVRREVELVLPGRCDPGRDHGRPRGVRHRRQRPHQPRRHCRKARGRRSPIATSRSPPSPRPPWSREEAAAGRRPQAEQAAADAQAEAEPRQQRVGCRRGRRQRLDAVAGRARQSRRPLRPPSPQHRLHGGRRASPGRTASRLAQPLLGAGRARAISAAGGCCCRSRRPT